MMKRHLFISILLITSLMLGGCNIAAGSAPASSEMSTAAAQTVQAVLATPTQKASPVPGVAIDGTTAEPPTTGCEDNAGHTSWTRDGETYDVNVVNTRIPPKKTFHMAWVLQNTGTCTWNDAYKMHFDYGTQLTTAEDFPILPIGAELPPGGSVTVTIPMSAPEQPGDYESNFSLQDGNGESVINFGVLTKVGNTSTTSLTSPGELRYTYDCSSGSVKVGLTWTDRAASEDGYRVYRDGDLVEVLPAGSTSYEEFAPSSGIFNYTVASFNSGGESPASMKVNTENCG